MEFAAQEREGRLIAEFCAVLPRLREAADKEGWAALLEAIEAKVQLRSAPPEETLDELWEYLGLRGVTRRGPAVNVSLEGQDPLPPPKGTYRCPAAEVGRRCARSEAREPSGPVPECALHALPMRFVT
jgi:hypothetical protein